MAVFSPEENKGFSDFTREQRFVFFENNVANKMNPKLAPLMEPFLNLLVCEDYSYSDKEDRKIKFNINDELVNLLCDRRGYVILDYMVYYAKFKAVKYLVGQCNAHVNIIDNNTLTSTLLKAYNYLFKKNGHINLADDKFIDRIKIFAYLSKMGAFAFTADCYIYDENVVRKDSVEDFLNEKIQRVNIELVSKLLYELTDSLGKSSNKDDKILIAIDCLTRVGFMPSVDVASHPNFAKYNLYDLFDLTKKPFLKISEDCGVRMTELIDFYSEDYYLGRTQQVINANIYADTFTDEYKQQVRETLEAAGEDDEEDAETVIDFEEVDEDDEDIDDEDLDDEDFDDDDEEDDDIIFEPQLIDCLLGYENLLQIRSGNKKYDEKFPELKDLKTKPELYSKFVESINNAETYTFLNELCWKNQKVIDQKMALLEDDELGD